MVPISNSVIPELSSDSSIVSLTPKEITVNNKQVLRKRKKFFHKELKDSLDTLCMLLIFLLYFKDLSMLRFSIRLFIEMVIARPYLESYRSSVFTDDNKRQFSKVLLVLVTFSNVACFLIHFLFGAYDKSPFSDGYLHGGYSIQIIGEQIPSSKSILLITDIAIFVIQIVLFNVTCVVECEISPNKIIEGDGYTGQIEVVSIDLINNVNMVRNYEGRMPDIEIPSSEALQNFV